ncbi:hypothetical protein [Dyella subtropica]|uniref:hypothetical protein n=1 Tax=Dyella subtropica TaxID=2992127 RepID=UPI00225888F7|nr:hypothetical protein [Dyella subtropica]
MNHPGMHDDSASDTASARDAGQATPLPAPMIPTPLAAPYRPRVRKPHYILAHWRGDLPLAQAYWLNGVLLGFVLTLVERVLIAWLQSARPTLTSVLVISLAWGVSRLAVSIWQVVGILRSAALSGSRWAIPVNILMVLAIFGLISNTIGSVKAVRSLAHAAAEQRGMSDFSISVAPGGTAIVARGSIGVGYAQEVKDAFAQHPLIHRLVLDSRGGDVDNGMQLHDFLVTRPDITVEVDKLCASSCTLAFLGGAKRLVAPTSTLGFHQLRSMLDTQFSNDYLAEQQENYKKLMIQRGASPDFIRLALAKQGTDVYTPDSDELFANGIITGIQLRDREVSAADWRGEQFLWAYRESPVMRGMADVLEQIRRQQPAVFDAWTQMNIEVKRRATRKERIDGYTNSLWKTLHTARNRALRTAPNDNVRHFAEAQRDLLTLIREHLSDKACGEYLAGMGVKLGDQGDAFYQRTSSAYIGLLSIPHPKELNQDDWLRGARELAQMRKAPPLTPPPPLVAGAKTREPFPLFCRRQLALLDRLLVSPSSGNDMALRTLLLEID